MQAKCNSNYQRKSRNLISIWSLYTALIRDDLAITPKSLRIQRLFLQQRMHNVIALKISLTAMKKSQFWFGKSLGGLDVIVLKAGNAML